MSAVGAQRWSVEDTRLAFYLYCQLPFGKLHHRNPEIRALAETLGRTPGAVAMKLSNFASLDPSITSTGRRGLANASSVDRRVWDEFHADWATLTEECQSRLDDLSSVGGAPASSRNGDRDPDYDARDHTGETREAVVQQRKGQDFFRRAVLSTYDEKCCISGVSEPRLLVASHIVAWKDDPANRLNPRNGLCLSALHDRAFDQHMISLSADLRLLVSPVLEKRRPEALIEQAFLSVRGKPIAIPKRFRPDEALLAVHREKFLARQA